MQKYNIIISVNALAETAEQSKTSNSTLVQKDLSIPLPTLNNCSILLCILIILYLSVIDPVLPQIVRESISCTFMYTNYFIPICN